MSNGISALLTQEARIRIDAVRARARSTGKAAAALRRLQGRQSDVDEPGRLRSNWVPSKDDEVQIPKMGGAVGQVCLCRFMLPSPGANQMVSICDQQMLNNQVSESVSSLADSLVSHASNLLMPCIVVWHGYPYPVRASRSPVRSAICLIDCYATGCGCTLC